MRGYVRIYSSYDGRCCFTGNAVYTAAAYTAELEAGVLGARQFYSRLPERRIQANPEGRLATAGRS